MDNEQLLRNAVNQALKKKEGRYEVMKSSDERFYFVLKAGNGEVVLTSQMYKAKASALDGIESIKINANSRVDDLT
ncbi:YegP family protein [Vibrio lentus]|uniref:YegP family protein n=1 Tax=Vibrio TaxID=662 RepID=UPI000C835CF5|nr:MULTISPECIES: YegP family protein [Vibrio]MCB5460131.1 YegP family protein [Vibrio lentus]MCC4852527.1 YegP family protein [Vibrio lentus]MCC5493248.1 YegP family protein [Vibrio lentus]MCC5530509.1 YegP family protein [Vibrio lentus]MCC5537049.1 YegP family protein [Vibrio lentus]